jgi:hypothetical protein
MLCLNTPEENRVLYPDELGGGFKKYMELKIDRNCDVLPLSLEDLLNYTTLMLKFCTKKPIWALLLRQVFLGGGEGGVSPKKKV